jgi:3-deoxy-D-manno-octulosonic acid (KDO) 8-phosphate synthase
VIVSKGYTLLIGRELKNMNRKEGFSFRFFFSWNEARREAGSGFRGSA